VIAGGDTGRLAFPLGNFQSTGATSCAPGAQPSGCREALAASCPTNAANRNSPFASQPCGICAGHLQRQLKLAGCTDAEIESYCENALTPPESPMVAYFRLNGAAF